MSTTKKTGVYLNRSSVAAVYFYIILSGVIIFVSSTKQSDYIGMLFGTASLVAVFILYRILRKARPD